MTQKKVFVAILQKSGTTNQGTKARTIVWIGKQVVAQGCGKAVMIENVMMMMMMMMMKIVTTIVVSVVAVAHSLSLALSLLFLLVSVV